MKSYLVGIGLLLILLGLLFFIMDRYPYDWWWIAGMAMAFVSTVFATLFPVLILPIFNKYTPVENKELTDALDRILSDGGLKSSGFFVEDMRRQTKKENAFLAGVGRTRRVVMGDNLIANMTVSEIVSIIAHEVGHFRYRHIWKHIVFGSLQQLVVFFLLNLIMKAAFPMFLSSTRANLSLFPFLAVLMGILSGLLFGPLSRALSRHFKTQADRYALKSIPHKDAFVTALAGLANRNLSNAYPSWWMILLYYSHPPIGERLRMAERFRSA